MMLLRKFLHPRWDMKAVNDIRADLLISCHFSSNRRQRS